MSPCDAVTSDREMVIPRIKFACQQGFEYFLNNVIFCETEILQMGGTTGFSGGQGNFSAQQPQSYAQPQQSYAQPQQSYAQPQQYQPFSGGMSPQAKGMQSPQGYGPPPVMANPVAVNNAMSPQAKGMQSPQGYGPPPVMANPVAVNNAMSPQLSPMGFGPNGVNGGSPPVSLRLSAQDFPPNPKGVNRGIPDMFNSPRLSPQDYGTVVNGSPPDLSAPISGRGSPIYSPRFQR